MIRRFSNIISFCAGPPQAAVAESGRWYGFWVAWQFGLPFWSFTIESCRDERGVILPCAMQRTAAPLGRRTVWRNTNRTVVNRAHTRLQSLSLAALRVCLLDPNAFSL